MLVYRPITFVSNIQDCGRKTEAQITFLYADVVPKPKMALIPIKSHMWIDSVNW